MLDDDLLSFVRASIRSTWALELLLLLRRQRRALADDELVRSLRASRSLVSMCLSQLQAAGLVVRDEAGLWRYAPATPTLSALSDRLEQAYGERPVTVINAIAASPDDRLRNFADAFRFPKKDE